VDDDTNLKGNYEYYYTHALISKEAHEAIQANCNFTGHGSHSPECQKGLDLAGVEKGMIDVYNIYAPLCPPSGSVPSDDLVCDGIWHFVFCHSLCKRVLFIFLFFSFSFS